MQPIFTERLILRAWEEKDFLPFARLNQDPRVMEYFPNTLTMAETQQFIAKISTNMQQNGFGLYACALHDTDELIGFVGLSIPSFDTAFTPCVEIGWRLAFEHWGKGYATEAAQAVIQQAFEVYKLKEIVAFTAKQNMRSRKLMEKLSMWHNAAEDFHHPKLPLDHPLSLHVLYRLKNPL